MFILYSTSDFGLNYDYYWNIQNYCISHEHENVSLLNRRQLQTPFAHYLTETTRQKCIAIAEESGILTIDSCLFHVQQHYAMRRGDHTLKLCVVNYHGSPDRMVWNIMDSLPSNIDRGGAVTEQKMEYCSPIEIEVQEGDELILVHSMNVQLLDSTSINISHDRNLVSD
jgi:hypothetical protein